MRILSAHLQNFKIHRDRVFEFQSGTNAICGENGAGKSTILQAIAWVLFDFCPSSNQDELISEGASSAEVVVNFISVLESRTYGISRNTQSGYKILDLELGVRLEHTKKNDVQRWLRQHLGIPAGEDLTALFVNTIGVPQGTFTADFLKTAAQRKQVFDQVLKVEEYQTYYKDLLGLERFAKTAIETTNHQVELLQVQLEKWDSWTTEQTQLQTQLRHDQQALSETEANLTELATAIALITAQLQQRQALEQQQQAHQQELALHSQTLQQTEAAITTAQAAATELATVAAGYDLYRAAEAALGILEQQWQARQTLIAERQTLTDTAQQQAHQRDRLSEQLAQLATLAEQLPQLEAQIQQQSELEQEQTQLVELAAQLQELHNELAIQRTKLTAQTDQLSQAERNVEQAAAAQAIQAQNEAAHRAYTAATAALQTLKQHLAKRQSLLAQQQRLQAQVHAQQLQQAEARQAQQRLQQIEAELSQLSPAIAQFQAWQSEWQAAQAAQTVWQQRRLERDSLIQRLEHVQANLPERQRQWQQRQAQEALVAQIPQLEAQLQQAQQHQAQTAAIASLRSDLEQLWQESHSHSEHYAHQVQHISHYCQQHYAQLWPHLQPILAQGVALPQQILAGLQTIMASVSSAEPAAIEAIQTQLQTAYAIQAHDLASLAAAVQQLEQEGAHLSSAIATLDRHLAIMPPLQALEQQRQRLGDPLARAAVLTTERDRLSEHQVHDLKPLERELAQLEAALAETADLALAIQAEETRQSDHHAAYIAYLQAAPLVAELPERQAQRAQVQAQVEAIAAKVNQWQQQIATLETEHGSLQAIQTYQQELANALKQLGNPRQQQSQITTALQKRPQLEAELLQLTSLQTTTQAAIATLETQLEATASLDHDRQTQQQRRDAQRTAYETYLRCQPRAAQLPELEATQQQQQQQREHLKQALEAEQQALSAIAYDPDHHAELQAQQQTLQTQATRLQVQIESLLPQIARISAELERLSELRQQQVELEIAKKQKEKVSRFIRKLREVFRDAGPKITVLYQQSVNYEADRLFREIMNRMNLSLHWEADYEIVIQEGGQKKRRFSNLSGGEQMVAALAVRLALLRSIASFDVAFFDEPTTNMDTARRQRLAEAIAQIKSFSQLFVISHDDTFTHLTESTLRIER